MYGDRLDFELDHEVGFGPVTAHGGVPVLLEYFRSSGAASIVDREVSFKRRKRGLSASEIVESLLALWAEQDVILCDEFRDGHVSAGSGCRRVVEGALGVLPESVEEVRPRADSALYDHALMVLLDQQKVGFAISVPVSDGPRRRMAVLEEADWRFEREEAGAARHWAEPDYLPDGAIHQKEGVVRRT